MPLGNKGWNDKIENYAEDYSIRINGTTATGILGQASKQPIVVFSITISVNQAGSTGDVVLIDTSSTADAGTVRQVFVLASAQNQQIYHDFPRGLVFNDGVVVSATTVTGAVCLTHKPRYY